MAHKKRKIAPQRKVAPPRAKDPFKFIKRETGRMFYDSLVVRAFVIKQGFHKPNAYFNLIIQQRKWTTLCEHPPQGMAPLVHELYANLPFRDGTKLYVRGVWVRFDRATIKNAFKL